MTLALFVGVGTVLDDGVDGHVVKAAEETEQAEIDREGGGPGSICES